MSKIINILYYYYLFSQHNVTGGNNMILLVKIAHVHFKTLTIENINFNIIKIASAFLQYTS